MRNKKSLLFVGQDRRWRIEKTTVDSNKQGGAKETAGLDLPYVQWLNTLIKTLIMEYGFSLLQKWFVLINYFL